MTKTRIEVPTIGGELSAPHFDDETTIITARPVVPIARAKAAERSRFMFWILPTALSASIFGGLSAVGVNYLENRQSRATQLEIKQEPQVNQPPAPQLQVDEAAPSEPASANGNVATGIATPEPESANPQTDSAVAGQEDKAAPDKDPAAVSSPSEPVSLPAVRRSTPAAIKNNVTADESSGLVRKRRVNSGADQPSGARPEKSAARKNRGAARIIDIFEGPNYR